MNDLSKNSWHALAGEEVLEIQHSSLEGLKTADINERLKTFGPNVLPKAKGDGPIQLLWRQINNPLIFVLLASAALAIILGKGTDGFVVLGVVVLNTIIGFLQEFRAGKAIEALGQMVPQTAMVLRNGERLTISAAEIVPGDIVFLQSGDKVPADMRLLANKSLQVEEAALTGESVPTSKTLEILPADTSLNDRKNMVYGGTLVTYGTATAVVTATGASTELGRISALLRQTTEMETPLTKQLAVVGNLLTIGILILSVFLSGIGLLRGYPFADAVLAAITLAVGAIPEGLPAIVTIALAIGVQHMARRKAIIRRLPAVETLGSTSVICSDKTGTLTRNEMTVKALWLKDQIFELTGIGYEPKGELKQQNKIIEANSDVKELILAGLLCNDASLRFDNNVYSIEGDPTEGALVVTAEKIGLKTTEIRQKFARLDTIPFESERQFMATLHKIDQERQIFIKGAPEVILKRCGIEHLDVVEELAAKGMRVLALAKKTTSKNEIDESDVLAGFEFLGLQAMIDPPRAEAIEAVKTAQAAGITVKMITGDHKATAQAIGQELGIATETALTGREIENMSQEELEKIAPKIGVFARVAPEHKLRLVRALQANGAIVAMTGDGVNDAPALKQADIGVAMGITGTAVSKEAADIVLTDDNFASITAAVEEGRRVYDNLVKSLAFVLPTNLGLALILLVAVVFFPINNGQPLLAMQPTQLLWINLVATVALALPLAFEAMEPGLMKRAPRNPKAPILSKFIIMRTLIVAILMAAGSVGLFLFEYNAAINAGFDIELALREAQTMAVTTVILFQIFYLLNCRSLRDSIFKIGLFSNKTVYFGIIVLLILQITFIYLPFMQSVFSTAALKLDDLFKSLLISLIILPVITIEKLFRRQKV